MRTDLIGLLSLIYKNVYFKFDYILEEKERRVYILSSKDYVRSLVSCLRYGSNFFGTRFHDLTAISFLSKQKNTRNVVLYVFYLPRWNIKLFIVVNVFQQLSTISDFFSGASWPERECYEMFGIGFTSKIDSRHLLLDYVFEGHPLVKIFDVVGYEEIEYNIFENWIVYTVVKLRDDVSIQWV